MKAQAKAALGLIFGLSLLAMVGSIVEACFLSKLGDKSDISCKHNAVPFIHELLTVSR